VADLLSRSRPCALEGKYELFETKKFDLNDSFSLANRMQIYRPVKAFEVTYLRVPATADAAQS
jgi:hypothetical protein